MNQIDIRIAGKEDIDWSAHLMTGTDPWIRLKIQFAQCRKNCSDPEFSLYIAWQNNKKYGMILLDPRGVAGSPYIKSIAVEEECRSQGIGKALIAFAEKLYMPEHRYIFLCVSSFNTRARKLYENLGYVMIHELENYIIEGESEFLMCKRLLKQ